MTATPSDSPRRPRRPKASPEVDGDLYSPYSPRRNPAARLAYALAVAGLIPLLGLPLGLTAIVVALIGWQRAHQEPAIKGHGHCVAAMILGTFEVTVNGLGLALIASALEWW